MKGIQFYKKANNILGWLVFLFAAFVYISTMEKTGSFWDCGEFVPGAYKLQVVHPPGAPFFNIIGRIFTLFAFGDVTKVAMMINLMSALSTAFVVLFGFWSTSALLKKLVLKTEEDYTQGRIVAILGSAFVAGLSITFLDSLWFSAVEGEVYALSMFFMTFVIWATLKWDADDSPNADRWLLLIAFMIGLSTGVHLLSLLAIPFTAIIYYLKKFTFSFKGFIIAFLASFIVIGIVMKGVISGFPSFSAMFDKFFVNTLGLPFNSGVIFFMLLVVAGIIASLKYAYTKNNQIVERIVLGLIFVIVGYSSFLMVPIRSAANPPINMNRPTDAMRILSYVNREQYGDRPLVFGPDYTVLSPDDYVIEKGTYKANKKDIIGKGKDKDGNDRYITLEKDAITSYEIKSDKKMLFPRLGVIGDQGKIDAYRAWMQPSYYIYDRETGKNVTKFKSGQLAQAKAYAQQQNSESTGKFGKARYKVRDNLSWSDNIKFFFNYQMGFMYFRYFMWNFSGRQNDIQGTYANADGGWITGINAIDNNLHLWGSPRWTQDNLSLKRENNKAHNKFYGIPFLLGIFGFYWLFKRDAKLGIAVLVMFLTAGTFFIVYGNQPPIEPRERDYVIVGSLFIYAIWLGMSVYAFFDLLRKNISGKIAAPIGIAIALIAPILMGSQGWDDHNRNFRTIPVDMATNYLESCAPNAVIFTQGDNDTYPLWYAQEVEGIRTDIRIINVSLLGVDWYINQLRYKMNDAAPLKLTFTPQMIEASNRNQVPYVYNQNIDKNKYYSAKDIMKFVAKDDPKLKAQTQFLYSFPTRKMSFPVSKAAVEAMDMTDAPDSLILPEIRLDISKSYLMKNDLLTIDIVANNINERPIYFAISVAPSAYIGFQKYFQQEGLTYRIVPVLNPSGQPQESPIRREKMYDNMMNKYKWGKIAENPNIYMNENIMRMTQNLVSNFTKLAEEYSKIGDHKKAVEVLDRCLAVLPLDKINISYIHSGFPAIYLKAGETEKAKNITDKIIVVSKDELKYMLQVYNNNKRQYPQGSFSKKREVWEYLYMLQRSMQTYQSIDQEYFAEIKVVFDEYNVKFQQ